MFLLSFVPDAWLEITIDAILITGAVLTFLSFFVINRILSFWPGLSPYYHVLQIISATLLLGGVYFKGSYHTEAKWREKVAAAEAKIKIAEKQAEEATGKIETKVVTKIKLVKGQTEIIEKEIIKEIIKYDEKFVPGGICEIPIEFINLHNRSAEFSVSKDTKQ